MNELTGITHPDSSAETLTYDDNGNLSLTTKNGETTTYEWDCFDRMTGVAMLSGDEIKFTYDGENKMTKIEYPDMTVDLKQKSGDIIRRVAKVRFNGMETPVEKEISSYDVIVNGQILSRYNSNPVFTSGSNSNNASRQEFCHYDHNNNLALITDSFGNIQWKTLMDAYGNVLPLPDSTTTKPTKVLTDNLLTGGAGVFYIQRAKMYNMRRRFYNALMRRFNSVDPFKMGVNYFSYTDNNPLGYMDASGLAKIQSETFDIFNKPKAEENKEGNKDAWIRRLNKANEFVPRMLNTDRCLNAFYEYGPGGLSKMDYRILAQWNNISISFKWTDEKFMNFRDYRTKYGTSFEFAFVPAEANDYSKIMMSLQMITNYYASFLNQVLVHELAHTVGVPGDIAYNGLAWDQYHVCCEIISWECLGLSDTDSFYLRTDWPKRTKWWIDELTRLRYIDPAFEKPVLLELLPKKESDEKKVFNLNDRVKFYGAFNEYKTLTKAKKACKCLKKYADSFPKNYNTYVQNFYNRYIKERK